ncbi:MAG: peptidylprolyl isomerase [Actinobacteria bacterium]|nr:peptidylprolyl isomerase [Actinomycetota bacterium]
MSELAAARQRRKRLTRGVVVVVIAAAVVGIIFLLNRPTHKSKLAKPHASVSKKTTPCPASDGSSARRTSFSAPPPMCINPDKSYTAKVVTTAGDFTIALDAKSAPKTVNDFVFLARYHFYDGLIFHRVIPGFVVQGGDPNPPTASNPTPSGPQGPGFTVDGEVPAPHHPQYPLGSVAMAKTATQPPGASGSQFFIVVGPQGEDLPPDYSLFGQVTSGLSTVDKIEAGGTASGVPKVVYRIENITISES